jgi:hypothetical protein
VSADVVPLRVPVSATEVERQRFEEWVRLGCRKDEAVVFLARSKGGDYVLATARAGWAAWQARGLCDAGNPCA